MCRLAFSENETQNKTMVFLYLCQEIITGQIKDIIDERLRVQNVTSLNNYKCLKKAANGCCCLVKVEERGQQGSNQRLGTGKTYLTEGSTIEKDAGCI